MSHPLINVYVIMKHICCRDGLQETYPITAWTNRDVAASERDRLTANITQQQRDNYMPEYSVEEVPICHREAKPAEAKQ